MRRLILTLAIIFAAGQTLWGMPPHPSLLDRIQKEGLNFPKTCNLTLSEEELAKAGISLARFNPDALAQPNAGPFKVLVILVDFSDKPSQVAPVFFDSLVFGRTQSSVRRYYAENSYGTLDLVTVNFPSALGWTRAPQTLAYYANDSMGIYGHYPRNAQKLVEDAVDLVDPLVNFADYDNNGDGYVDGLTVVHSGQGYEVTLNPNDIWSHKWAVAPRAKDGVLVFNYSIEPEYWRTPGDMTIGVFCHEFGHAFGLPDLYDRDYSSRGIGSWSVMSYGCWNGSPLGSSPAHFDAWCKTKLGFVAAGDVTNNQTEVRIPNAEQSSAGIFRLWTDGETGPEYFLVENRQKIGYDAALPAAGLLIWHIDEAVTTGNNKAWYPPNSPAAGHYKVALVQADNLWQLEKNESSGNSGDPYPSSTGNRTFNSAANPNSNSYAGTATPVRVENISNSGDTMTADFADFYVQAPTGVEDFANRPKNFQLAQNYPNPFNPATTISYSLQKSGRVELEVFNLLGEKVRTLVSGERKAGPHQESWDGTDRQVRPVSSGIYFYRLQFEEVSQTKKMMLIR